MNFNLDFLPQRFEKPRSDGFTMMTDMGLSVRQAENFAEASAPYTDFVKMAFGSSLLIPSLESKLNIYQDAGITPIFGGTLFEVFAYRKIMEEYISYLDKYGIEFVEVSDGTIQIDHKEKIAYIKQFQEEYDVISQATNFSTGGIIPFDKWIENCKKEIDAGAKYIIAKESEKLPIYGDEGLASFIAAKNPKGLDPHQLIWDAPTKDEQIELIKLFGNNVNICNVEPSGVISLETRRMGLHSSTLLQLIKAPLKNDEN